MKRSLRLSLLAACTVALVPSFQDVARAQDSRPSAPASAPSGPVKVHTGIYFHRIDQLDLKAASATVTFYVWMRWRGDLDAAAFEVMNGTLDAKDSEYKEEKDGQKYVYYRCRATVNLEVDFRRFPFDEHHLSVELEHAVHDTKTLVYEVDADSMKSLGTPKRSGWVVSPATHEVVQREYKTSWGQIGMSPDKTHESSRFRTTISLRHASGPTFLKTFLPLFIAMLITFLACFMHPEELCSRVTVGVAGIFGAATSLLVASDKVPEIAYMTLSDRVHTASLSFVFATLVASTISGFLARAQRVDAAKRFDRIASVVIVLGYIAVVVMLFGLT